MIVYSNDSGPREYSIDEFHDPDSKRYYRIDYRPPMRVNGRAYIKGKDVVTLSFENGCMYECLSGGVSALTEPAFITIEGELVLDGDVIWRCLPLSSKLMLGDVITSSSWDCLEGAILSSSLILNNWATFIKVLSIPVGIDRFILTNHMTVLRDSSLVEEFDKSLIIKVAQI
jgi:hypothetical protein